MDLTEEIEKLKQIAIDAIESLQHQNDLQLEMINSQSKLIQLYEQLLKDVLLSQDIAWEHKNLGHDWKDLMTMIRGILQHDKDNSRISN